MHLIKRKNIPNKNYCLINESDHTCKSLHPASVALFLKIPYIINPNDNTS